MKRKHRSGEYLLPDARFVPEATRIPECVAYIPQDDPPTPKTLYRRKIYPFNVEVRDLEWCETRTRLVLEKRNKPRGKAELIGALFGHAVDCFECP